MICKKNILVDVYQTGAEMRRLSENYWSDLGTWLNVPFLTYYNFVCSLPYFEDPEDTETVSRPLFTLDPSYSPRDCDDKAVLLASWFCPHGEKLRFVASSTRSDKVLHHTFIQLKNGLFIDATYKKNANFIGFYPYFKHLTKLQALTEFF